MKIPLLNSEKRSQIVPKDTDLGEVHAAEIVEEVANVEENPRKKLSPLERLSVDNIMEKMPKDITVLYYGQLYAIEYLFACLPPRLS